MLSPDPDARRVRRGRTPCRQTKVAIVIRAIVHQARPKLLQRQLRVIPITLTLTDSGDRSPIRPSLGATCLFMIHDLCSRPGSEFHN